MKLRSRADPFPTPAPWHNTRGVLRHELSMRSIRAGVASLAVLLLCAGIAAAEDFACDQEQSRKEVQRLTDAKLIASVDQFPPLITVVVDERGWARTEIDRKKVMAQHIVCAIGGPADTMLRTVIFRARNNKQLGVFSRNQLTLE